MMQYINSIIPLIIGTILGLIIGWVTYINAQHKLSWKYYNLGVTIYKNNNDNFNLAFDYLSKAQVCNPKNKKLIKSVDDMVNIIIKEHSIKMEKLKHGDIHETTEKS